MKHPAGFRPSYPRIIFTPEEARHLKEQPGCDPVDVVSRTTVWPDDLFYEDLSIGEKRNETQSKEAAHQANDGPRK